MPINAAKALPSMGVATLPENPSSSATVLPERSKLLSPDGPKLMRDTAGDGVLAGVCFATRFFCR